MCLVTFLGWPDLWLYILVTLLNHNFLQNKEIRGRRGRERRREEEEENEEEENKIIK